MQNFYNYIFSTKIDDNRRKDTGMAVVFILLIASLWFKNESFSILALAAVIINMTFPILFHPMAIVWFAFSNFLGAIVSRILLTIIFFFIVTPTGFIRRLLKKDNLRLKEFKKSKKSVMINRDIIFSKEDMDNPF
ncbi:MAG: hypothetical protein ABIJ59_19070 [Pseudomonadota bacterium]